MIQSVHIKNFRCLHDVTIAFEPLTVLVGPNASGKSSVLQVLGLQWTDRDKWQHQPEARISVERVPDASYGYQRHQLDTRLLRKSNRLSRAHRLDLNGSNLTNVFGSLTRRQQADFARQFCRLVPLFADVDTQPGPEEGHHSLRFQDRWNPDVWYQPDEVSDGSMLMVAFLTLQYQNPAVDVVGIEEPERGLHPYLVGELVTFLRNLASGKIGAKAIQVILATHSSELLEHIRPEEARFLDRVHEDGSVTVTTIDTTTTDWQQTFAEYKQSLGSAWLSGGLGGVPGAELKP